MARRGRANILWALQSKDSLITISLDCHWLINLNNNWNGPKSNFHWPLTTEAIKEKWLSVKNVFYGPRWPSKWRHQKGNQPVWTLIGRSRSSNGWSGQWHWVANKRRTLKRIEFAASNWLEMKKITTKGKQFLFYKTHTLQSSRLFGRWSVALVPTSIALIEWSV